MYDTNLIHKFYLNDKYVILDIYSGAVHVVDEIIYDLVDYMSKGLDEAVKALSTKYEACDIKTAFKEVEELHKEELLFTEPIEATQLDLSKYNIVKALCLHVSHDCNLRCKYCFASQGDFKGKRELMSVEVGKKALEFLVQNSGNRRNLEVDFFGGEPLMNFGVVKELVTYGRSLEKEYNKNFRFTLTTNCVLLNDEIIDYLNENMSNVVLSIDGRKSVNDEMRPTTNGKGSYDIIVPKIKRFIEKRGDKDYYIRGTFTSENLDFSEDVLDFYRNGFKKTSMEPVVTDQKEPYAIRPEHVERIKKEYEKLSKEYIKIKKKDDDFLFFHFMIDLDQGPCLIKRAIGCGAGCEYLAVTPKGDLYPCHQFVGEEQFKVGNVFEGVTKTDLREEFKKSNVFNKKDCQECWAKFYCSGGCHANSYYNTGDINGVFEIGCELERKRIECAISVIANLD